MPAEGTSYVALANNKKIPMKRERSRRKNAFKSKESKMKEELAQIEKRERGQEIAFMLKMFPELNAEEAG